MAIATVPPAMTNSDPYLLFQRVLQIETMLQLFQLSCVLYLSLQFPNKNERVTVTLAWKRHTAVISMQVFERGGEVLTQHL